MAEVKPRPPPMQVTVLEARNLIHPDLVGTPSTYVTVQISSSAERRTSKTVESSDAPRWESKFELSVFEPSDTLIITVHDNRLFTEGKSMGSVRFSVRDLVSLSHGKIEGWYPLQGVKSGDIHLSIHVKAHIPHGSSVAVIGGGFSGTGTAYFLSEELALLGGDAKITLFEREDILGGRVGNIRVGNYVTERGGTGILSTGHEYTAKLMEKFKLARTQPFELKAPMGLWTGSTFIFNMHHEAGVFTAAKFIFDLFARYGLDMAELLLLNHTYKEKFLKIYDLQNKHHVYDSPVDLINALGLTELTLQSFAQFLQSRHMNERLRTELCEAFSRANNGLNAEQLTAFVGVLGLTLDPSALYSVEGGNVLLIQQLAVHSRATVRLNSRVTAVKKLPASEDGGGYELTVESSTKAADGSRQVTGVTRERFQAVVLATPFETAHLQLEGFDALPPPLTPAGARQFVDVYEYWIQGEYAPQYFAQQTLADVPQAVLTTANPTIPFQNIVCIHSQTPPSAGSGLYKVYSLRAVSDATLKEMFVRIDVRADHRWQYAFPAASPQPPSSWAPFRVAEGFVYSSALENVFSNIEFQLLVAKNNAALLAGDLSRCHHCAPARHSTAAVASPAPAAPAAAAAAAAPPSSSAPNVADPAPSSLALHTDRPNELDVAVAGAGLSGLTAAYRLLQHSMAAGRPLRVRVLEATKQLGGRTRSWPLQHEHYEVSYGGTWCIFEDEAVLGVSYAVHCLPFLPALAPNWSPNGLGILNLVLHPYLFLKLWLLGHEVLNNPKLPKHVELDSKPLSVWLDENAHDFLCLDKEGAKNAVLDWFFMMENYPQDLSRVSTYFSAIFLHRRLTHITPTGIVLPQLFRFEGGTGRLIDAMEAAVTQLQGTVQRASPVTKIRDPADQNQPMVVTVSGAEVAELHARAVVVATAVPTVLSTHPVIQCEPPVPPPYNVLGDLIQPWNDPGLNLILVFQTQWWAKRGYGGYIYPGPPKNPNLMGVYGPVMDLSDHDPALKKPVTIGVLRILVKHERCIYPDGKLWREEELIDSAFKFLSPFFGDATHEDFRSQLIEFKVLDWLQAKEFIPAVTYFYPPTADQRYANNYQYLRLPHGRVHFAGTEHAVRGLHWMEGAVHRGNEIALEVLQQLQYITTPEQVKQYWAVIEAEQKAAINKMRLELGEHIGLKIEDLWQHVTAPFREVSSKLADVFHRVILPAHNHEACTATAATEPAPAAAAPAAATSSASAAAATSVVTQPKPSLVPLEKFDGDFKKQPLFRIHVTPHEREVLQKVLEISRQNKPDASI